MNNQDRVLLGKYQEFISKRRAKSLPTKIFTPNPKNAKEIAALIAAGGVVIIPWGKEERRIFCLVGCFDNPQTTSLMNKIKGRALTQTLALGCLPEAVKKVAEVKSSKPLMMAASLLSHRKIGSLKEADFDRVLNECFKGSIGLILKAKKGAPKAVTAIKDRLKTVMIAGERDYEEKHDVYNQMLLELENRFGKLIAGTSANPSEKEVYSVFDQEEAYRRFKNEVDGFVKFTHAPRKSGKKMFLTSSTVIDLTGQEAVVVRWGNLHPRRFKRIFPGLVIPKGVSRNQGHESTRDYFIGLLSKFFYT